MLRYKQIKLMVKEEIEKLHPGDALPSRTVLCQKFDTTRATLEKAIKELEKENYLYSKKGSGTYVVNLPVSFQKEKNNWGVIVPSITENIYTFFCRGAENFAESKGINLILCNSDNLPEKQNSYIERLLLTGVQGMIIIPVTSDNFVESYHSYNRLQEAHVPFVFAKRSVEGISAPSVISNDFYGAFVSTTYLLKKGYTKTAFLSNRHYRTSLNRAQGYVAALMENNCPIDRSTIILRPASDTNCYQQAIDLIENNHVNGFVCFNDYVAQEVYRAVEHCGYQVSKDIGVIGYDNSDICPALSPALTSVDYDNIDMGRKSAEMLFNVIHNLQFYDFEYYLQKPTIIIRQSCLGAQNK